MPRQFVGEIKDGDPVEETYLLADKQLRANRNANLYLLATLRDRSGAINGLMWNVREDQCVGFDAGDYVRVRGKVQLYQSNLQLILTNIQRADATTLNPEDFELRPKHDVEKLVVRVREILGSISDPAIRTLMECFLIDEALMEKLQRTGAGIKAHHAYPGGLVEHVLNILEVALRIRDFYPTVNFDLVLAGIFLHDIGKVREMDFDNSFSYTDEGQLLGHMSIGVEMVTEKAAEYQRLTNEPFPRETELRLKHMVLSHHGSYEHGSSRLPMTPEAIVVHHLDNLDAKVHEFSRAIEEDLNPEATWTPYIPRLERKIFKGQQPAEG